MKTIALLELTGPNAPIDNALANTFKYYWDKKKYPSLPFRPFPIANTSGLIGKTLELLDKYYAKGFRLFIGFNRSNILEDVLKWFDDHPDAIGISLNSVASSLSIKKNIYRIGCVLWNKKKHIDEFLEKNTCPDINVLYNLYTEYYKNTHTVSKQYFIDYVSTKNFY